MDQSTKIIWALPEYMIAGTLFTYDSELNEFAERDVPSNRISMEGVWSEKDVWTQFFFDSRTKNIYTGGFPGGERPGHVQLVLMPTLPHCDRLGIHVKTYHEKQSENKVSNMPEASLKQNQRKHKKGRGIS
jgi:hypothetical protein